MFESEENAIVILKKDHEKVKDLFEEFESADRRPEKLKIAALAIKELKAHIAIEEEIFYPTVRAAIGDRIMNEAEEEHHVAKVLIAELESMTGAEEHFDAKFKVLAESIKHHIKEEEGNMLPKAKDADIDLDALGEELLFRKQELLQEGFPISSEERMVGAGKGKSASAGKRASGRKKPAKRNGHEYKGKSKGERPRA